MTWSRFDDAARKHPKALMAGNEAWALWCASIMYCNQYSTDGFVPDVALATEVLPCPIAPKKAKALAQRLSQAKVSPDGKAMFSRDEKRGGWIVNDFLDWNPSKFQVESKRKKDRDRKRMETDSRSDSARNTRGSPNGKSAEDDEDSDLESAENPRLARAGPGARARSQPAQPADPDPPYPPPQPTGEAAVGGESARVPKPKVSPLTAADVASLVVDLAPISQEFIRIAVQDWLRKRDTKQLFPHQWHNSALTVVTSTWRDPVQRKRIQAQILGVQDEAEHVPGLYPGAAS